MWLQVQEMLHIEKGGAEQIAGELETYNPLIPQGRELIATLMLEIEDAVRRETILKTLGGIEETISIDVNGSPQRYADRIRRPHHARRQDLIGALDPLPLHAGADRRIQERRRQSGAGIAHPITATWR
jgi:hypothetical protein